MKTSKFFIHFIALLIISTVTFGQTQINGTTQIKDRTIGEIKLTTGALRPINSGALSGTELTFDQHSKKYTLSVTSDIALTLAASGNITDSYIQIGATGDGTHELTFPSDWVITGTWVPENFQQIFLFYDGTYVTGEIRQVIVAPIAITLVSAVVTNTPPTNLNLITSEAVNISLDGWSVTASGGAVILNSVENSGTTSPILVMDRAIVDTETITVSYDQETGETTSLTGTRELATITNQAVTPPEDLPDPEVPQFDVVVGPAETFTTIQAGINAAVSGDIIGVKAGTYRETPVGKSGVTVKPFPGEIAIVSALELVGNTGWTVHSGSIYKKTIALPMTGHNTSTTLTEANFTNGTILGNQIFKDGDMQFEARWPNVDAMSDLFEQSNMRHISQVDSWTGATSITDDGIPVNVNGGVIAVQGWFKSQFKNITSHSGTTIGFQSLFTDMSYNKYYYVTNKLTLLDAAKEWHYEGGILYYQQSGGGTPTGLEYKARNWGFDLRNISNFTIEGLHFIGCDPVKGNSSTSGIILDNIRASYLNHTNFEVADQHPGFYNVVKLGSFLSGPNHIVRNSEFEYSSCGAIWLGENGFVDNNYFFSINYEGDWGAPVNLYGTTNNQTITNNSMFTLGRGALDFGPLNSGGSHLNVEFGYNWVRDYGTTCWDLGATYGHGGCNMSGLEIHHNWFADNHAPISGGPNDPGGGIKTGSGAAVYFDQGSGPRTASPGVHHNVTWGDAVTGGFHETAAPANPGGAKTNWWNNTFSTSGIYASYTSYIVTYNNVSQLDVLRNNIFRDNVNIAHNIDGANGVGNVSNNLFQSSAPTFVGGDPDVIGGLAFRITSGSAGRNTGVTSFTGAYNGVITVPVIGSNVDMGAYDFDDPDPWTAGYNATPTVADGVINDTDFTYSTNWTYSPNFKPGFEDGDAHFTVTLNSTATYPFTGSQVSLIAEECDNMGVARITIRNAALATVQTADVDLYNASNPAGTDLNPCPAGVLSTVFTSSAFGGGVCTGCTIEIKLQTQNTATTPDRNALVFDGGIVVAP